MAQRPTVWALCVVLRGRALVVLGCPGASGAIIGQFDLSLLNT